MKRYRLMVRDGFLFAGMVVAFTALTVLVAVGTALVGYFVALAI